MTYRRTRTPVSLSAGNSNGGFKLACFFMFLVIVGILIFQVSAVMDVGYVTATVKRDPERSKDGVKMVYTTAGPFTCSDSVYHGKWASGDLFNDLDKGVEYKFKVTGYRIPFLSMYQNIIEAEPTAQGEGDGDESEDGVADE